MKTIAEVAEVIKLEINEGDVLVVRVKPGDDVFRWMEEVLEHMDTLTSRLPAGVFVLFHPDSVKITDSPTGAELVWAEREKQLGKGFGEVNDAAWKNGEMARAAAFLALPPQYEERIPYVEGFLKYVHGKDNFDRVRQLTIAGALIAAEIDRLKANARGDLS